MTQTPEEKFEQWWNKSQGLGSEYYFAKQAWLEAYRLGQQQGMEEAAKICESKLTGHRSQTGDAARAVCIAAIRQAAKEIK